MDRRVFVVGLLALMATGCSSVSVQRDPGANDKGIRFYRPKPYLLVTPADPTGRMVNLKLEYLPDFNEEYSAHLKGKKAKVELQDGWNLVAAGVGAAPPPPAPGAPVAVPPPDGALPKAVVAATNVPMGYYESVYDVFAGRKIFKGWRYIGFLPLGGPTTGPCAIPGMTPAGNPNCASACPPTDALYGVVFFNGAMTFRTLGEIAGNQLCPTYVDPAPAAPGVPAGTPVQGFETPRRVPESGAIETGPDTAPAPTVEPPLEPLPPEPIQPAPLVPSPGLGSHADPAPRPLPEIQPAAYSSASPSLADQYASEPLDLNALPALPH